MEERSLFQVLSQFFQDTAAREALMICFSTSALDIILGVLASIRAKKLSSKVSIQGFIRKGATYIVLLYIAFVAALLDAAILFKGATGVVILTEILSVLELLHVLGVRGLDKWLLMISKETLEEKSRKYGIFEGDELVYEQSKDHRTEGPVAGTVQRERSRDHRTDAETPRTDPTVQPNAEPEPDPHNAADLSRERLP